MKNLILLSVILLIPNFSFSQNVTNFIKPYCKLLVNPERDHRNTYYIDTLFIEGYLLIQKKKYHFCTGMPSTSVLLTYPPNQNTKYFDGLYYEQKTSSVEFKNDLLTNLDYYYDESSNTVLVGDTLFNNENMICIEIAGLVTMHLSFSSCNCNTKTINQLYSLNFFFVRDEKLRLGLRKLTKSYKRTLRNFSPEDYLKFERIMD